jgi:hypothetical protein
MKDQAMGLLEVVERFRLAPEDGVASEAAPAFAAPVATAIAPIRFRPAAPMSAPRREARAPAARPAPGAPGAWKEF